MNNTLVSCVLFMWYTVRVDSPAQQQSEWFFSFLYEKKLQILYFKIRYTQEYPYKWTILFICCDTFIHSVRVGDYFGLFLSIVCFVPVNWRGFFSLCKMYTTKIICNIRVYDTVTHSLRNKTDFSQPKRYSWIWIVNILQYFQYSIFGRIYLLSTTFLHGILLLLLFDFDLCVE